MLKKKQTQAVNNPQTNLLGDIAIYSRFMLTVNWIQGWIDAWLG